MFARFNVVPYYAYCKLKMSGPHGVITVNGEAKLCLGTTEYAAALTAEAREGTFQSNLELMAKTPDTFNVVQTTSRQDSPDCPGLN